MSCLQRNYFRRASLRSLVPDNRLLISVLTVGCESHTGVYIPNGLVDDTGLNPDSVSAGLKDLEMSKLIEVDKETREIFLTDFFRDNKFSGAQRNGQAASDFSAIESSKLKSSVLDAIRRNPECGLNADFLCKKLEVEENQKLNNKGKAEVKEKVKELAISEHAEIAAASSVRSENKKEDQNSNSKAKNCIQPIDVDENGMMLARNEDDSLTIQEIYQMADSNDVKATVALLAQQKIWPWPSNILKCLIENSVETSDVKMLIQLVQIDEVRLMKTFRTRLQLAKTLNHLLQESQKLLTAISSPWSPMYFMQKVIEYSMSSYKFNLNYCHAILSSPSEFGHCLKRWEGEFKFEVAFKEIQYVYKNSIHIDHVNKLPIIHQVNEFKIEEDAPF